MTIDEFYERMQEALNNRDWESARQAIDDFGFYGEDCVPISVMAKVLQDRRSSVLVKIHRLRFGGRPPKSDLPGDRDAELSKYLDDKLVSRQTR